MSQHLHLLSFDARINILMLTLNFYFLCNNYKIFLTSFGLLRKLHYQFISHTFLTVTSFDFNISFVFKLSSLENKQTSTLSECKECGKGLHVKPTRRQIP